MMKIYATSDLHVDAHPNNMQLWYDLYELCLSDPPDVLIIGGDLAESMKSWSSALDVFKDCSFPCLIVPGNHDLWCRNENVFSEDKLNILLPEICHSSNWIFLPRTNFEFDNYTFVGDVAWYDYSLMPEDHPFHPQEFNEYQRAGRRWMDSLLCKWRQFNESNRDRKLTEYFYCRIEDQLSKVSSDSIFLVTHFPFYSQFLNFTGENWDYEYFGAYMGSNKYLDLLERYPIKYHLCGHLHRLATTEYANCKVFMSPIGYIREWNGMSVKERLQSRLLKIEV